jgi:hypothetical protein
MKNIIIQNIDKFKKILNTNSQTTSQKLYNLINFYNYTPSSKLTTSNNL